MRMKITDWMETLYREQLPDSPDVRKILGIPRPAPQEFPMHAIAMGTWNAVPIGAGGCAPEQHIYAVRVVGHEPMNTSPLVVLHFNRMITVAGSLSCAVPMLVFRHRLFCNELGWTRLMERWDRVVDSLDRVHRFFGGTDNLAALREVVMDTALRSGMVTAMKRLGERERVLAAILMRLDPAPEHIALRRFLVELLDRPDTAPPPWKELGPWRLVAAAATIMAHDNHGVKAPHVLEAAWEVVCAPAGVDTDVTDVTQVPMGTGAASDLTVGSAARLLSRASDHVPAIWKEDPIWLATMKLVEAGQGYDGFAHVEAARKLDEAGQPSRALDALQSATFWSIVHHNHPLVPVFEAAHDVIARCGWEQLQEYMSYLARKYNQLIKQPEIE